ncbi:FAD-dependent oxidoreductase [Sphingomonas arenae]|uniref:FAD-dependent oxidoreductase n=1 Tax=Sphingomonas arenae TaxID=2812555 RepID=UPI001967F83B|nr:FAD-dependent oxidoreductase [Sphingomonas arenae]
MAEGSTSRPEAVGLNVTRRSLLIGAGGAAVSAPAIVRAQGLSRPHTAVIGAGVFGAWTAEQLRRAGHRVTLVDPWGPAHSRASSGGESRMTRGAYGKDEIYTRMALASLAEWKQLSAAAGLPIFAPHGVLFFFPREEDYLRDSLAVHRRLGLATEALSAAEMARRFPMIDFAGISTGLFEPEFGALMARRAVQTLVAGFIAAGGEYRSAMVTRPEAAGKKLQAATLASGERLEADKFVFACGPWMGKLFPELLAKRIVATRQEVFYFAAPPGDPLFQPGRMPGWADFNDGDIFYGFPDLEARGMKFAHDAHGAVVDPDTQSRRPTEQAIAEVIAFRDRRFPRLRGAPLIGAEVCQYENSSNGDFLIDRHPEWEDVVLVGGGSGHGFKHGPEVGRYAAGLVTGAMPVEPRFSLATKGETQKREVH